MEDIDRIRYANMLTARMKHAKQASKTEDAYDRNPDRDPEWSIFLWHQTQAADEEVRAMIRQIAVAANFDSEIINQITGEALARNKEDK